MKYAKTNDCHYCHRPLRNDETGGYEKIKGVWTPYHLNCKKWKSKKSKSKN